MGIGRVKEVLRGEGKKRGKACVLVLALPLTDSFCVIAKEYITYLQNHTFS